MENKHKSLSAWRLTMLALGTVIGGSFFLGSAVAINAAGPAVIFSFILGGVFVYFILYALAEMTAADPQSGSFRTYAAQAFGKGMGFTVGWVYWTGMVLAMSSEAAAISVLLRGWLPGISIPAAGTIVIVSVTLVNLLGADKLSTIESGLAAVKIFAVAAFVITAVLLIAGAFTGGGPIGVSQIAAQPLLPGGIAGVAGSMLIVMFTYAGFEVIGLATSETDQPQKTIPRAIAYTVLSLVGLYLLAVTAIVFLVPTAELSENTSPIVAALNRWGMGWAGTVISVVMVTAILSTMLAAMFGIGRMLRSLTDDGFAPRWLKDSSGVPRRGILFSGAAMLAGLGIGLLFPRVYLFLISSGGYALLFTYAVIMASHLRLRKKNGCPGGRCLMPGYPVTTWIALMGIIAAIVSMPFVAGQESGLIAGLVLTVFFGAAYLVLKALRRKNPLPPPGEYRPRWQAETSKEPGSPKNNE